MTDKILATLAGLAMAFVGAAHAQSHSFSHMPDPRGEFIRLCAPYMIKRSLRPEAVCDCLYRQAVAMVDDAEVRDALLYGISETGVPTIDRTWLPAAKENQIDIVMTRMAKPTMACLYGQ
ncbi:MULTISPECIES: hypothetical protein [unclassified Bradyrhizobium]|uniref:hypothetical protein n=1 Tax=unclassified Bradyrhizobium TaxID=2631580 RepID=UPI0020124465|nr:MULTISPECIES: hypothetical protein [unclassified Bradyrhizobium]